MTNFQRVYTDEQRDAVATAFEDRGIKPAKRVADLAAAGELEYNGRRLEPFTVKVDYVRELAAKLRRQRLGKANSSLADLPPRDSIEILRRRLVTALDGELALEERKRIGTRNLKRMGEIGKLIREAQAIPGRDEPRKPAPGQKVNGQRQGGAPESALARQLLDAAKVKGTTASDAHTQSNGSTENAAEAQRSAEDEAQEREGQEEDVPGSFARSAARRQLVA